MALGSLYTSMAGLETTTERLDTVSQNLANTNTQGYAAQQTAAMALPYAGSNPPNGADVISLGENVDTSSGPMTRTGSPFDVAVNGGWLVVQTHGGGKALTRNGQLAQSANGLLTTMTGSPVLDSAGNPISLPLLRSMTIAANGDISGIPAGSASQQPQVYGRFYLAATPAGGSLRPLGNTLYGLPPGTRPSPAANASVQQGYLEGSNVSSVKTMIDLIDVSRGYQMQTQIMGENAKTQTELNQIMMA